MTSWNLLGHEWAVEMLRGQIRRNTLSHAYLFVGPPGVGRRTLALHFAQALLCPEAALSAEPCGVCRTCRQIEAMQYADLTVVQAEREGGVLKVEQVRAVRQSLTLKPYQGRYRIVLFLRFQEAHPSAANALLKTLEEAPAHAILLLTADHAEQLLPTIVSRCEVVRLRPVPLERLEEWLQTRGEAIAAADNMPSPRLLAHLSGGRPGYALRLRNDTAALEARRQQLNMIRELLAANRRQRFAVAEALAKDRETLRSALLLWLTYWRDVLLRASGAALPITNLDYEAEIGALAAQLSFPEAQRLVREMEAALERLEKNVNARLLTEVLLLNWPKIAAR